MNDQIKGLWLAVAVAIIGLAALGISLGRGATASPSGQAPPTLTPAPAPTPAALPAGKPVYSVKFLCGFQADGGLPVNPGTPVADLPAEPPVKPGNYATEINIHNPQETQVSFGKKAVLSGFTPRADAAFEQPFPPGPLFTAVLEPDFALEIDCADITQQLLAGAIPPGATFIKGFVVLEPPQQLDVVAVYTAERVDEHKNVECLVIDGRVVEATLRADGTRKCPIGTKSIGVGQGTGTGMTMDVEYIAPRFISPTPPPPPPETPTPAATPTPPPIACPGVHCWGDVRCDQAVDTQDADAIFRYIVALSYSQTEPCPDIGTPVEVDGVTRLWGDLNCDGVVNGDDQDAVELFLAALPINQLPGCPIMGSVVQLGP